MMRSVHRVSASYCSCYDSYVDKVLRYFRDTDDFCTFKNDDLKQYNKFKKTILAFRTYYKLEQYTLKEIDQYIWQLGKDYFPKNYYSKKS